MIATFLLVVYFSIFTGFVGYCIGLMVANMDQCTLCAERADEADNEGGK